MRILIVEDDEVTAKALTTVLSSQNYAFEAATDGQAGWELVEAFAYDLVLLDVILPKLDGISLCQKLRRSGYQMPVLLLTGRDSSHDKAVGLDAGADDYLVKPFDAEELVARIRALLRRGSSTLQPVLEWGSLRLDPSSCEVTYAMRPVQLTPKEYSLLELFLRNSRRVFSCGAIVEHLWSYEETPGEEAVRTHIKGLRQKLKSAEAPTDLIETVYGIGYRLKPLEARTVVAAPANDSEQVRQQTLLALAGVWERFKGKINEQVDAIEQACCTLEQQTLSEEIRATAEKEAHTLAGSLGTFGLSAGSQLARKIEHLFQPGESLGQKQVKKLRKLVAALRQEISKDANGVSTNEPVAAPLTAKDERPLLLVVDSDRHLTLQIAKEADIRGIRIEVATKLSAARLAIARQHPNVVLLNLSISKTTEDALALLAQLSTQTPPLPVLVFSARDNLTDRLEVARLGGSTFLHKPVSPAQVLESVTQVLQKPGTAATNQVMIVDDDPQILATVRQLLEPWGLNVTTLEDPRQFWETLKASEPDLLILDIKMPHASGVELCQVVRNDSSWSGLPIVFLTARTDAATVNQVFAAGADDFVSKPIVGPELVTRVINRLERIKLLRSLSETDPLTGVHNRKKSTQELERLLSKAQQQNQPLSLAILNLDSLKLINNHYDRTTGDRVLYQMGQLLRRSVRGENVVSRWGGDEFVVGMYGMTSSEGVQRLTEVLEIWRQHEFVVPALPQDMQARVKVRVTFSAGVAQYPEDGTDLQSLYRKADAALYQAKVAGRDRVLSCT